MAQVSITVPDACMTRLEDAFAATYGYQAIINGQPNPETKAQHARRKIKEHVWSVVRASETRAAAEAASITVGAKVDADFG